MHLIVALDIPATGQYLLGGIDVGGLSKSQLGRARGPADRVRVRVRVPILPTIILADEPTGALETTSTTEIMVLLGELHEAGRTIVVSTHEEEVA